MTGLEFFKNDVLKFLRPFLLKGTINEGNVGWLHDCLSKTIPFFSSPIFEMRFPEVIRITINKNVCNGGNERLSLIRFLKYPPQNKVTKYGRANLIGQSVFYCTTNPITALNEIKPKIGDLVTTSTWRQKENDYFLKIIPIFKITSLNTITHNELSVRFKLGYENALQQYPKEVAEQIDELLKFISEGFAKDVDYNNNYDYALSAYYANKILYDFEKGMIDALIYPSVADKLEFSNLAIKPDIVENHFDIYHVEEGIVRRAPNEKGGNYFLEGTFWSRTFRDGVIVWK